MYKTYCEEAKVSYPYTQRAFKEELKNYFREYKERYSTEEGSRIRSYYKGFLSEKFSEQEEEEKPEPRHISWLDLEEMDSIFDRECAKCPAQYGNESEAPTFKWDNVKTILEDLDTRRLHYVRVPENHIVIDLDIRGRDGQKSLERNLEEAAKWPPTYAELSKGGNGLHLHYIYTGDPKKLSRSTTIRSK